MRIDLTGKRALVLGASGGLGGAIARGLGEAGARVAVSSRSGDKLASQFPDAGTYPRIVADLATPGIGRTIAAQALDVLGGVDILVNNSGGPPPTTALGATEAQWRAQFDAMVMALVDLTGALVPGMRERGWGRIVTVASSGIVAPIPNLALSNALRSALLGWSKTLAGEVAGDGVTVNLVLPGRIATSRVEALDKANAQRSGRSLEEVAAAALATIPAGRYGAPEEFAAAAVFLASPQASYITGTTLRVDGGALRNV
ncbi:SDR family oxidoreductase [Lichenibacterium ramalinae]|uniref:SDR family oxidoreductase n=1 Tax=Lichenibacterium ramalinae TaxID=2316527 RepID=A0A4Q2RFC9_9HYPH|nr:SDR family oxidoreductase [Lichenibacterium ramalinae]RYB06021.1 SDR family oxidoreductase [Lichenibacterium ramalinae]